MKSIVLATAIAILIGLVNFKSMPVSWYDLTLVAGSLWAAKAQVAVWLLSPLLICVVAWIEIQHLQSKINTLDSQLSEAGKQVLARDGVISSLKNQLREMGRR